jgi:hypothetical protein
MKDRLTRAVGDYVRTFSSEDGNHYRTEKQELGPAMRRAKLIQDAQAVNGTGKNDRRYVGSIPKTVLIDWLRTHGYQIEQFARNDGGDPYKTNPHHGNGVKDKFLKYFLSRDFAKLHSQHVTTKRESSQIVVPNYIGKRDGDTDLRGTKD